jgi:mandelate racemase
MSSPKLTLASIHARPLVLPLKRPIVARIATITEWPLILIDLVTEEGIVGRSYLEPYTIKTMRYLVPALHDFGEMLKGRTLAPFDLYDLARRSLHFVGYQGLSQIAVSGLDMAAWDALAKGGRHAALRLPRRLPRPGPRLQQQRPVAAGAAGRGRGGPGAQGRG